MKVAVIDGEGGTVGAIIIRKMRQTFGDKIDIWALGTNAIATGQMLKAGANRGAAGEAAITWCAGQVQAIIGPISMLLSRGFLGEITPSIVDAIGSSKALKLILPISHGPAVVVSTIPEPLPSLVDALVNLHLAPLVTGKKTQSAARSTGDGIRTGENGNRDGAPFL